MQPQYKRAILILTRAFCIVVDRWTNRGFKIRQEDGSYKVDVIGAIALANEQLYCRHGAAAYTSADLAINLINDAALYHFGRSAVSVNDDLGYMATIKLYALAIERGISHGLSISSNIGRPGCEADRGAP